MCDYFDRLADGGPEEFQTPMPEPSPDFTPANAVCVCAGEGLAAFEHRPGCAYIAWANSR